QGRAGAPAARIEWRSLAGLAGLGILERARDDPLVFTRRGWRWGPAALSVWICAGRRFAGPRRRRRLRDASRRSRTQVVRRLEPLLPRVEVHRGELPDVRTLDEQVE